MSDFKKCTSSPKEEDGYTVECKLGLWSVSGGNLIDVLNEAYNYFAQYKSDGEYDELLDNPLTNHGEAE